MSRSTPFHLAFLAFIATSQAIVEAWAPSVQSLDVAMTGFTRGSLGFNYGFTDGSYGYWLSGDAKVARFNLSSFTTAGSLDLALTDSSLTGFFGGFTDGTYGYLVPYDGKVARFDLQSFTAAGSLDLALTDSTLKDFNSGFTGGTDGNYGYLVQHLYGKVARFNLQSFAAAGSLDLALTDSSLKDSNYGFTDGTYGYLVPYDGKVARFDLSSFTTAGSLDLALTDSSLTGFFGGFTDGTYGYSVPRVYGKVARFDLQSFIAAGSLDLALTDSSLNGFIGGFAMSDRYGILVPYDGKVARFSLYYFHSAGIQSWDLALTDSSLKGFVGGFTDGAYGYLFSTGDFVPVDSGLVFYGKVARFDEWTRLSPPAHYFINNRGLEWWHVFLIVLAALLMCCCCCCCCRFYRVGPFRSRTEGKAIIKKGKAKMQVPYHVENATAKKKRDSEDPENPDDSKLRVVWELDEEETRQWFQKARDDGGVDETPMSWQLREGEPVAQWDEWTGEDEEHAADGDCVLVRMSNESDEGETKGGATDDTVGPKNKKLVSCISMIPAHNFAFERRRLVEYFSSTMGIWVPAKILKFEGFKQVLPGGGDDAVRVFYTVRVESTDQVRRGVALDELRYPLRAGERVEVFVGKRDDTPEVWLPGNISGATEGSTLLGYKVTFDQTPLVIDVPIETVQAVRVRRRFEVGTPIEVYFGVAKGWLPGNVLSLEDQNLEESTAENLTLIDPTMTWQKTRKQAIEDARKAVDKTKEASRGARHWMLKGGWETVGPEWHAWPLLKVKVNMKRAVEPPAPTTEQPAHTGEQPTNSPTVQYDNEQDPPAPAAEQPPPASEPSAPTTEQPTPTGEQPTTSPKVQYDNEQAQEVFVVPAFLLRQPVVKLSLDRRVSI